VLDAVRSRLTYANVTATLALVLAVSGGTVYAVDKIGSSEIAKNAVKSKHVKNDSLGGKDVDEAKLSTVPSATSAETATSAGSANPEAFAHVLEGGSVDAANSKGVTSANVTAPGDGVYCFTALPLAPRGAQATQEYPADDEVVLQFSLGSTGVCPAGTQAFVQSTDSATSNIGLNTGFYIAFYR
jgi:hypothetical protein